MPGSPIEIETVQRIIKIFESDFRLSSFEVEFLNSIQARYTMYGMKTLISEAQVSIIDKTYLKILKPLKKKKTKKQNRMEEKSKRKRKEVQNA